MSDAKHTPPGDASFRTSLLRAVGGAVGLVVFVAAVFGAIGMFGHADDDTPIADGPDEPVEDDEPDVPVDPPDDTTEPEDPDPADDVDPDPAPPQDDEVDEGDEGDDGNDDAEPAPAERQFTPADITVQVLDGYQADGGSAAAAVAAALRDAGYQVVAENPALRYDVTTVLWTAGFEAQGQQVAAEIDAAEVREQPGNLSTSVQVHVVVGADRG